jgi:hypothetical protein
MRTIILQEEVMMMSHSNAWIAWLKTAGVAAILVLAVCVVGSCPAAAQSIIVFESETSGTLENAGLDRMIERLSVKDADVRTVIQRIAAESGVNILMHPALRGTVTLDLRSVRVGDALRAILKSVNFSLEIIEDCPPKASTSPRSAHKASGNQTRR